MLPEIKNEYLDGRLMLFLGAGASADSLDCSGNPIPLGDTLARELAEENGWNYNNESLNVVYSALESINSTKLYQYLRYRLTDTKPSKAYLSIARYPWSRIYTTNIDDCLERALKDKSSQRLSIFNFASNLEEIDTLFQSVQLVKLNGCANNPQNGFIFSPQEYGEKSAKLPPWYRELAQNSGNYTFLYIGSRLNEPLLQHIFAMMREELSRSPLQGYVITPKATEIERHHLNSLKLTHISGTIDDFANWMKVEIPKAPSDWDLATARRPEYRHLKANFTVSQKRAINCVTVVSPETLPRNLDITSSGSIRNFYRGFKPTWSDIVDDVPARISQIEQFVEKVRKESKVGKCFALVGQAGTGKSTALMTAALNLSQADNTPVYFLREAVSDLENVIQTLEELNPEKYFLFIDKIDSMHSSLSECIEDRKLNNGCIVFSERINIWTRRVRDTLRDQISGSFTIKRITTNDANLILEKIHRFGPWTRLEKMSVAERMNEIYRRSDRQLLIGLLEATTGMGFVQIIKNDYANIGEDEHRKFLVLVGLGSIHRCTISPNIVGRAVRNLSIADNVDSLMSQVEGIVVNNRGRLSARHPVYVRELFEKVVDPDLIRDCLIALLLSYADYESPVVKKVSKEDGSIFKSIINHRFVREMMQGDVTRVRRVYETFETKFHVDGLYWLQYGLALRGFGYHQQALDILRTARQAFESPQIEHAYGQQLLIIAEHVAPDDDYLQYLNEAISILEKLDVEGWEGDTYPIVSLAEGHIRVAMKFQGTEEARSKARSYCNTLLAAKQRNPDERLNRAITHLMKFATTGILEEKYRLEKMDFD